MLDPIMLAEGFSRSISTEECPTPESPEIRPDSIATLEAMRSGTDWMLQSTSVGAKGVHQPKPNCKAWRPATPIANVT